MSDYPPIANHGLVGDLQTAALIASDGTVDWWCTPRFDSPSLFASLLDSDRGGRCRLGVDLGDRARVRQLYLPDTPNAAADQIQLDIYGEAAYALAQSQGIGDIRSWQAFSGLIDWLCDHWDRPDEGIWETRGGRHDITYSRLMTWVAFDRAIRLATTHARPADLTGWRQVRDAVFQQILQRGWNAKHGAFVQHYETEVLDASLLLMPKVGFLSPNDPYWLSTLDAITDELVSDSLVYRYDPSASPDGLRGSEGTFSLCSFLYVEALARSGRTPGPLRVRQDAHLRQPRRFVRRGDRPVRRAARQFPAGLHPPRAHRRSRRPRRGTRPRRPVGYLIHPILAPRREVRFRRCFLAGLTVYGIGAVLNAASPGLGVLIVGNSILEGVGTALLIPPVYILTTLLFTGLASRARAFGVIMAAGGVGAAAGPPIGGGRSGSRVVLVTRYVTDDRK